MGFLLNNTELSVDVLLMVMLIATMLVAFRLERALGVLRRDRASLEKLVQNFNDSTAQAENGIEKLKSAAQSTGRDIARHIDQARRLESDLQFLISRAEKMADRVEASLTPNKQSVSAELRSPTEMLSPKPSFSLASKLGAAESEAKPRSQAEKDLLLALRAVR
ncbi:DUF6468 domain-containing protein [Acetobacteraceae bacterium KSS8]|uniref:DUF6468 domain-containing protein n=1 Tax=Endosaccharibacter trunci TaxID=2812733 RepID=A0ABT1WBN5_9PROT|nr:DUF6468 domain-containing protein [Acetobacteraceae bacterium KSS8]